MTLHQFYYEVWTISIAQHWRIGQALFNHLLEVRPGIAEEMRATDFDPFHASSPIDPRYDRAVRHIEGRWLTE